MLDLFQRHLEKIRPGTGSDEYIACCPFHNDTKPSFGFNTSTGIYNCFSCGEKGNAITFAKAFGESTSNLPKTSVSQKKAIVWSPPKPVDAEHHVKVFEANDRLLLNYKKYVGDLPWHKSIVKKLFIGWDDGTYTFPYTNDDGKLVNIKWHKKKQVKGHAQTYIFPMWQMIHLYDPKKTLYVTEGEKDAVSLISSGHQAITLNNGCNARWPKPLILKIAEKFDEVFPHFDNDKPGRAASDRFLEIFGKYAIS